MPVHYENLLPAEALHSAEFVQNVNRLSDKLNSFSSKPACGDKFHMA